ncbi:MAG: efflux RND transporter periplasmic adaptor subunit [Planctomycetes bacterium]|nr:efflux RND transporter periplasmic adaptor subunit [Planctomycetota bacterium]
MNQHLVGMRSFKVVLKEKGELKAAKSTDIKSRVEGRATIISLIDEGKAVQEGDLLVELASDQIDDRIQQEELKETNAITAFESARSELDIQRDKNASDIRKADLEIELKKLELDKYIKGEWKQKLRDADIAIEEAETKLANSKEDWIAADKLYKKNFITKAEYRKDKFNFEKATWDLEKAITAREVLKTYTHVAESRKRHSDFEEAQQEFERIKKNAAAEENKKQRNLEGKTKELELIRAQLAKLRAQKENCRIFAPTPGFVVYYAESWRWGSGDQIKEGAEVRERQILMQLPDTSKMVVSVRIHESKTNKLALGQRAVIEVEGIPDTQLGGEVTKIAVIADTQNRWLNPDLKEYETEITLDPTDVPLKPGATAHVEILIEQTEKVLSVPVQSIFSKGGRKYVFRDSGQGVKYREVQIGTSSTEWAQVVDGLTENDRILMAFSDEHTREIPEIEPEASPGISGGPAAFKAEGGGKMPKGERKMSPKRRGGPKGSGRTNRRRQP